MLTENAVKTTYKFLEMYSKILRPNRNVSKHSHLSYQSSGKESKRLTCVAFSVPLTNKETKMGRLAEVAGDRSTGEKCKTFVFMNEGHTLGNALVTVILQNPDVEFCACFVDHPSDDKIYLRIQAKKGRAIDLLKRGLEDLEKICDFTLQTFNSAYDDFKASKEVPVNST